jgi:Sulfotransferase domain
MSGAADVNSGRPKVFGLGLIKTGTSSLREALKLLGYKALHGGPLETMKLVQQSIDAGEPMLSNLDPEYNAFADVFGVTHYFYLADVQYPGSRFILTVRDLDQWLESRRRHTEKNRQLKAAGRYRGDLLEVDLDAWEAEYRRHEAVVRAYFADRPDDLLVYDLAGGKGWGPLCAFLGQPVPDAPFPRANEFREWSATPS